MLKLLALFTIVPLVELALLIFIGERVGLWPTVGLVFVTGGLGAWLAKREGLRVLREWQASLARGQMPEEGVLGGLLVLVGGVLLITPGVVTDLTGLLLLLPPTRRLVAARVRKAVERRIGDGSIRVVDLSGGGFGAPGGAVIDGVAEEVTPRHREAPSEPADPA